MNTIKFSHNYFKLSNVSNFEKAKLILCLIVDSLKLPEVFVNYDTLYFENGEKKYFPLAENKYLLLLFHGKNQVYTTLRSFNEEKYKYYSNQIGNYFNVSKKS